MPRALVSKVPISKLPPGARMRLAHPPFDVLLVNVDGVPYAVEDACNHAGESLSKGPVRGCEVTCPAHGYVFDLRTGALRIPAGLCGDQRTFEVERDGDEWAVYDPFGSPLSTPRGS